MKALESLPDEISQQFSSEPDREIAARLTLLLQVRLASLEGFAGGLGGLQQGHEWLETVERDFQNYNSHAAFRAATDAFWKDRIRRIQDAVGEIEKLLGGPVATTDGYKEEILDQYLSLPRDRRPPISLEYMFIADSGTEVNSTQN